MMEGIIEFSDWEKIDLRVGQIKKVEDIEGADKLWKLTIDVGEEIGESKSEISIDSIKKSNQRVVCAGIKEYYSKEELEGKKIILFVNLAPRKLRGIESQGMILAAVSSGEGSHPPAQKERVVLISPEKDIEVGSKIR